MSTKKTASEISTESASEPASLSAAAQPEAIPAAAAAARLRLRAPEILENLSDAFIALDTEWRIVYANRQACEINKRPLHEFLGRTHWEEWPESVGTQVEANYRRAMAEKAEVHFEHHYLSDTHDLWLEIHAYPFPTGLNLFYRDISERIHTQEALRASEEQFRAMADALPQILWTTDSQGRTTYFNRRWYEYSGMSAAGIEQTSIEQVIHPDDRERVAAAWQRSLETRAPWEIQFRLRRFDGQYRLHLGRTVPIDEEGQMTRWIGTSTDIEEQAQAVQALRRSQENLQLAVDGAQLGTFYCEFPLDKIHWNATCRAHFFLPPDTEIDFARFYSLLHPEDVEPTRQAIEKTLAEHGTYDVEYRVIGPEGQIRWINAIGRMFYSVEGQPLRFDGITIDITTRKEAEAEMRAWAEREALINRIGNLIRSMNDPRQIQATALRALGEALQVDRCYFALIDSAQDSIVIEEDYRRSDLRSLAGNYQLSRFGSNLEEVFAAGTTLVVEDNEKGFWPDSVGKVLVQAGLRSVLSVPFRRDERLAAALGLGMADSPRAWTSEEVALAESVAVIVRSAVDMAQIAQKQQTITQKLQAALQPITPESVPGLTLAQYYRPAKKEEGVGGDFSDVFATDKATTFLIVGDLSGKGLAAASQVAMVRHMLRFALYNGLTVADSVAQLNQTLVNNDLLSGFSTLFVGRYEAFTRTLTYVNAGQDAGLILRRSTRTIELLTPTGPVLGAFHEGEYQEETVTLEAGDVLALYTDGLTEAGPSRTALLTGDGVAEILKALEGEKSAQEIMEYMVAQVDHYAQQGMRDDQCLLVAVIASPPSGSHLENSESRKG